MYNFDLPVERRETGSIKWDVGENELPMWVADMDFKTAPQITEIIENRAKHGIFGYTDVTDEWYDAYIGWWKKRHNFEIKKDWLIFCTGVVPAISSIVRKLTTPAEKVVLMTPVYNIFFNSILNNGRNPLQCELRYKNGSYHIDFEDLERKLADNQTSMLILCNPQNPTGNIWDKETLIKIGEMCFKHGVTVISDEIHCDITSPGKSYVPFASVSEKALKSSITCIAPTKAFNIAGIQTAAVYVPDPVLRHKVWRGLNTDEVAEPNVFAVDAAVAAFTKGEDWLDELRNYIYSNKLYAYEYIKNEIPEIKAVISDATYLLWLEYDKAFGKSSDAAEIIRKKTGLYLCAGEQYGKGGEYFLRMNIACPRSSLEDGLKRLKSGTEFLGEKSV